MKWILLLLATIALTSCTVTRMARLYDLEGGTVLQATYKANGSGHGAIAIHHPTLTACNGEYSTIAGGSTEWGAIYGNSETVQGVATSVSNDQRGQAIATCADGTVFECEYVTNLNSNGHGACRDTKQHRYRLMF